MQPALDFDDTACSSTVTISLPPAAFGHDRHPNAWMLSPDAVMELEPHPPMVGDHRGRRPDGQRRNMARVDLQSGALGNGEVEDRLWQTRLIDRRQSCQLWID